MVTIGGMVLLLFGYCLGYFSGRADRERNRVLDGHVVDRGLRRQQDRWDDHA